MTNNDFTRNLKDNELDFLSSLAGSGEALENRIFAEVESIEEKYVGEELIAEGGSKKIYKVKDSATGRYVALARPKVTDEIQAEKFLREARITAALEHPNIIPVHDICLEKSQPCFTMKLIEGQTLEDVLKSDQNDLQTLLDVFIKVCEATSFAHSKGVIHLDIKPANIQISGHGEVLLCDWGLARIVDSVCENPELERFSFDKFEMSNITLDGQIKGTPGYMAPEQAGKGRKTVKTDIYMLGALLFEILYKHPPVEGENLNEVISKTLKGEVDSSEELEEGRRLKAVVLKSLSKHPDDRYESVEDLKNEIIAYCSGFATGAENAGFGQLLYLLYNRNRKIVLTSTFLSTFFLFFIIFFIINLRKSEQKSKLLADQQTMLVNQLQREKKEKKELAVEAVPRLLNKAYDAFMRFRLKEAEHFTEMLLELEPELEKAWNMKARILFAQGSTDAPFREPESHLDKIVIDYLNNLIRRGGDAGNKSLIKLIDRLKVSLHPEAIVYLRMLCTHPNNLISNHALSGILEFSKVQHCDHLLAIAEEKSGKQKKELIAKVAELLQASPKWPGQTRYASIALKMTDDPKLRSILQTMTSVNIALFKEVSSVGTTRFPDYFAVDGIKRTRTQYWEAEPSPASLTIDLGTITQFNKALIYFYFDKRRFYQYKISSSIDGLHFKTFVDMSKNKSKSELEPFTHRFSEISARYVRLDMIKNSSNPAIHVREIELFNEGDNLALGQWIFSSNEENTILVDGKNNLKASFKMGEEITVDLGEEKPFSRVSLSTEKELEIDIEISNDGQKFLKYGGGVTNLISKNAKARYVKIRFLSPADISEISIYR